MRRLLLTLAAVAVALPIFAVGAALPANDAVAKGSAFIHVSLAADGSYGSTSAGQNMDAILAIRASGFDPAKDRRAGGQSPADYLVANAGAVPTAAGAGKAALAAKALSLDPKAVGSTNLIAKITSALNGTAGRYAADDFGQSLAILGLACTGNAVDAKAVTALKDAQLDSGGWGFDGFADADTTGIAIQALIAAGVAKTDPVVAAGLAHLRATQAADGGWGYDPAASNASSTAFALQALLALGEDAESAAFTKGSNTPVSYLLSQQLPDGSFEGFDPLFATNQVVPALAGRTFCNAADTPITRTRQPAATPTPITTVPVPSTATTTAPATVAPAPPSTGTGVPTSNGSSLNALIVICAAIVLSTSGAALALRRR